MLSSKGKDKRKRASFQDKLILIAQDCCQRETDQIHLDRFFHSVTEVNAFMNKVRKNYDFNFIQNGKLSAKCALDSSQVVLRFPEEVVAILREFSPNIKITCDKVISPAKMKELHNLFKNIVLSNDSGKSPNPIPDYESGGGDEDEDDDFDYFEEDKLINTTETATVTASSGQSVMLPPQEQKEPAYRCVACDTIHYLQSPFVNAIVSEPYFSMS